MNDISLKDFVGKTIESISNKDNLLDIIFTDGTYLRIAANSALNLGDNPLSAVLKMLVIDTDSHYYIN